MLSERTKKKGVAHTISFHLYKILATHINVLSEPIKKNLIKIGLS